MERPIQKSTAEHRGYSVPSSLPFLPVVIHELNHYVLSTYKEPGTVSSTGRACNQVPTPMQSTCRQKTPHKSYFIHLTMSPARRPQIWEDTLHFKSTCPMKEIQLINQITLAKVFNIHIQHQYSRSHDDPIASISSTLCPFFYDFPLKKTEKISYTKELRESNFNPNYWLRQGTILRLNQ